MDERHWIDSTNIARIKIASQALQDTLGGYGPLTEDLRKQLVQTTARLFDEYFTYVNSDDYDSSVSSVVEK